MARLAFLGDIMLARGVTEALKRDISPVNVWGTLRPIILSADARFINLECAITNYTTPIKQEKAFYFRVYPKRGIEVLREGLVDFANLANNHILDFNSDGLAETIENLKSAEIKHAGAGMNITEAKKPARMIIQNMPVSVFAFTDNEPLWEARDDSPGVNYIPIDLNDSRVKNLFNSIKDEKKAGRFIILTAHWGPNMRLEPGKNFIDFAHAAVKSGVDIFWGHSAHLFQGVEKLDDGLIIYDAGDAVDDYAVDPTLRNDWSFCFLVDIDGKSKKVIGVELVPLKLTLAQMNIATGDEAAQITDRMIELSKPFGTGFKKKRSSLLVQFKL